MGAATGTNVSQFKYRLVRLDEWRAGLSHRCPTSDPCVQRLRLASDVIFPLLFQCPVQPVQPVQPNMKLRATSARPHEGRKGSDTLDMSDDAMKSLMITASIPRVDELRRWDRIDSLISSIPFNVLLHGGLERLSCYF